MNRDLESQLREMGPEYRAVVEKLLSGRPAGGVASSSCLWWRRTAGWLGAAAVALAAVFGVVVWRQAGAGEGCAASVGEASQEYMVAHMSSDEAIKELVRSQRSDGGWGSDFLTRQNAHALGRSQDPSARLAYRKAVRNLRLKGLSM
jgi:hypothetical protein